MSNKLYDILKWITLIVLPACGTLYFALAQIWGFPYGEEVVGTIAAITTFMGVCLGINSNAYNKAVAENDSAEELPEDYFESEGE